MSNRSNRNRNYNGRRNTQGNRQGKQQQGRGNQTKTIAREMGSQISREVGKAIGQLGNQLAKTLNAGKGNPSRNRADRNQDQPRSTSHKRGAKGKANQDRNQSGKQVRSDKQRAGKSSVKAWSPSLNRTVEGNERYLTVVLSRLVKVIGQSVGFEAPVVEIRYEIEKHLSEMQHSDSGKVEAAGFSAELANINYSYSRIATLTAMGAIPVVMVEALFTSVSKRDLETIADLCSFKDQTGGKNGITIMAPFTLESSKAAIESVLDQVEIAHLPMLSSKDSDPFKAVEEMISSPFGKLCARVNTTPAQVIAKARARVADPTKSVTTNLRKVS